MSSILLLGVLLNFVGAGRILFTALQAMPGRRTLHPEFLQYKLFTAGTAAVFGSLYLYLYFRPTYVMPMLVFGAALKSWACVLSVGLHLSGRQSRRNFLEFGVSNGVVAALFWYVIAVA